MLKLNHDIYTAVLDIIPFKFYLFVNKHNNYIIILLFV